MCLYANLFLFAVLASNSHAADKPNIVFIFIDDMGYGDISPSKKANAHWGRHPTAGCYTHQE